MQVHPSDELARERGKIFREDRDVVCAKEKGAVLATDSTRSVKPEEYGNRLVETGEIMDVLNFNPIKPGDTSLFPAGRVHAIGKGAFVAEIKRHPT